MLIIGWCGTVLYLLNHAYISLVKNWRPSVYFGANLLAASSLTVQSVYLASWQAAAINGFWMLISALLLLGVKMDSIKANAKAYFIFSALLLALVLSSILYVDLAYYFEILGWSSAFFFCSSYFLFSAKRISSRAYLAINTYSAIALMPQLWTNANYPVFTLEVAWAIVSIIGIVKSYQDVHLID